MIPGNVPFKKDWAMMTIYILQLHDAFVCVTAGFMRRQDPPCFNILNSEAFP